jgi:UDP-3-O-[3-hydroxymyristoyl] glucosamine N-acyltransferase
MAFSVPASIVAELLGSSVSGTDVHIVRALPVAQAGADALAFVGDVEKHAEALAAALGRGAAVLVPLGTAQPLPTRGCVIPVENPRYAFALALAEFFAPEPGTGIAETARVHPMAHIDPTACIGEYTVVLEGATVGAHTEIRNHVVIGRGVSIGHHSLIKSHAVVGEDGFGFEKDPVGNNVRIPHIGSVEIGDHVELGCFTTVCAGTLVPTVIGDYAKISDHVHVSHNCRIGENAIITAGAEISGGVTVGERVWIGPNAAIIDGITIGRDALIGIGSVILRSVADGEVRVGNPDKPLRSGEE